MTKIFYLAHDRARRGCANFAMSAPNGWRVQFDEPKRTNIQNDKYHAMIGEIAKQYEHCGKKWSDEDMKRLLIDSFKRDTRNDSDFKAYWDEDSKTEMVPSLDGSGVVMLGTQSRKFPKRIAIAFIEFLYAFGADANIIFTE